MKHTLLLLTALFISLITSAQNEQAQKLVEKEKYNAAATVYKSLLKSDPKRSADYYYYLGDICWRKEKNDSAQYYFMEGVKADETNALNYVGIGKAIMKKNPAEGQRSFDKALQMTNSKDSKVLNAIGEYYILFADKKEIAKAVTYLLKSTDNEPKDVYAWMFLGDAYGKQGDGSKQVEAYNRASILFHSVPLLKMKFGKLYTAARNFDLSVKYYKEGLASDSTYGPIYRELGELYSKFKKYDLSIQNYKKYLTYIDVTPDVEYRYATFLFLSKDYKETMSVLNSLEAKKYDNIYLYRLRGISNYELGNYDQAQKDIETFLSKTDTKQQLSMDYEYYGKTLLKKGQDSLAIQSLQQAVVIDTSRVDLYGEIGSYYYSKGKYPEAIKYIGKQVALNKNDAQALLNLGKSYYYAKIYAPADSCFEKLTVLKPTIPLGYLFRARVQAALDPETKTGAAKPYYEKVIELCNTNPTKYKNELIEANEFIGYYYIVNRDKVKSDAAWSTILKLDPGNKKATEGLKMK
ncbi:MAG: tetratricopeptide repeat protein [Cytophagales bacterium]|nr:tetratricopeptide repeat protein [Cytophaga sp.]